MSNTIVALDKLHVFVEGLDHPECVACGRDGAIYAGGEAGQIYRVGLDGKFEQIGTTGGFLLGVCLDGDGNVYACDIRKRAVMRVTPGGQVSVYSQGAPERPLVNPNYPVFDADGNLYVSDSGHWKQNDGCVMRIRPGGKTEVVTTAPAAFPNGLALAANGKALYVVLSLLPGVVQVPIEPDGTAGPPRDLVTLPRTVPDGLALDQDGNLFISCYTPDIIYRFSRAGELSIFAEDWQSVIFSSPTNLAFCGQDRRTLVVASLSRWHLARTEMSVPGQVLNYPRL
jgi:gluconolactonase